MFDFFRANIRWLMGSLLVLLVIAFVAPQGYTSFMDQAGAGVASVDGARITQAEWDAEHGQQVQRIRQQNPEADAKVLDSPESRKASLDSLIQQRTLATAIQHQHLEVSPERLLSMFRRDPQIATFRTADGALNKALISQSGMTSVDFERRYAQDLQRRQVLAPVLAPAAAASSSYASSLAFDVLFQQREVRLQRFDPKDYLSEVKLADADIEAFYKQPDTQKKWQRAESAKIEYLVLSAEPLKAEVKVSEEEAKTVYGRDLQKRFMQTEERHTSQILVKLAENAKAEDVAAARSKIEAIYADVKKAPARFGDIARQRSEDEDSANRGGDMDFAGRGGFGAKAVEDAAFSLKAPGDISSIVRSEFGFHVVMLKAVRGGVARPFEEVRSEIEDELRTAAARTLFAKRSQEFAEFVFAQGTSMKPTADKFGLQVQTATVSRNPTAETTGLLASPKLLEPLFAAESVRGKQNIQAVEVLPNQMVSARVIEYQPASAPPLSEVREPVRAQLQLMRAAAFAKKAGEARAKDPGDAGLGESRWISRAQADGLPRGVVEAALKANAAKLPVSVGHDAGEAGYWVVRVLRIDKPKADLVPPALAVQQYNQAWGQWEATAYLEALKQSSKVKIKSVVERGLAASATP